MSATTDPGAKQKNENVLVITTIDKGRTIIDYKGRTVADLIGEVRIDQSNPKWVAVYVLPPHCTKKETNALFFDGCDDVIIKEVFE
jgi:hypothetical protein